MNHPTVRFKRLHAGAQLPAYQSAEAAGMDLHACLDTPVTLQPGDLVRIPLGWIMAIPSGFEGQVRPRSGLAARHGITVPNAPGTIDSDYRGEAVVALINLGRAAFTIEHGMRVAQLVVAPVARVAVHEVAELDETARGGGGFGSTGH
ncbi:MAG: dUTP diphosphatase [Phycisphaerales bacterium]|jgi:dUTP pyrophosphatase